MLLFIASKLLQYVHVYCGAELNLLALLNCILTEHGIIPSFIELIVTKQRHMATYIWVNIGSNNGLLSDGAMPLLESSLIPH